MTVVECLGCGHVRSIEQPERTFGAGACPRCGYVGWAPSSLLTEQDRRLLRDVPLAMRPLDLGPWRDERFDLR
jgi:hypothetical protein